MLVYISQLTSRDIIIIQGLNFCTDKKADHFDDEEYDDDADDDNDDDDDDDEECRMMLTEAEIRPL